MNKSIWGMLDYSKPGYMPAQTKWILNRWWILNRLWILNRIKLKFGDPVLSELTQAGKHLNHHLWFHLGKKIWFWVILALVINDKILHGVFLLKTV